MLSVKVNPWLLLASLFEWWHEPVGRAEELSITLDEVAADLFYGRD